MLMVSSTQALLPSWLGAGPDDDSFDLDYFIFIFRSIIINVFGSTF